MPATGGTDNFPDVWRDPPPGTARTYAKVDGPLSVQSWLAAVKAGRTFSTNAPIVLLTVNGHEPGAVLDTNDRLTVKVSVGSIVPFDRVEIIANGEVIDSKAGADLRAADMTTVIDLPTGGWIAARVVGQAHPLVGDSYVFAHTSPVYVVRNGRPWVSREDATFLGEVVDAIKARVARGFWRSDAERDAFLAELDRAREVYTQRGR